MNLGAGKTAAAPRPWRPGSESVPLSAAGGGALPARAWPSETGTPDSASARRTEKAASTRAAAGPLRRAGLRVAGDRHSAGPPV